MEHVMTHRPLGAVVSGTILIATMLATNGVAVAADDDRPAELKVLDRWVGDWDLEVIVKPGDAVPQGSKSTFRSTIRWTVNDRILRCDAQGQGVSGDRKFKDAFTWLCTFEPQAKTYVSTVFWATVGPADAGAWGGGLRGTGTWDEQAKTLTTRTADPDLGVVSSGVTTWIDADTHEWVSTMTDATGKVVMQMTGRAKRRK
jgi:hypothetical protein